MIEAVGRELVAFFTERPLWLVLLVAVNATVVGAIVVRWLALQAVRAFVHIGFRYFAVDRSGISAGRTADQIRPITTYLDGFELGVKMTLGGTIRAWSGANAYQQLVHAEGLGLALRLRQALGMGPFGNWAYRTTLPPTASMGIGGYQAVINLFFGFPKAIPSSLTTRLITPLDAFWRVESYFFTLLLIEFRGGNKERNLALYRRMAEFAARHPEHGWALMVGLGRASHFVVRDPAERLAILGELGPLACYSRMGLGIPLLMTHNDDLSKITAAINEYPVAVHHEILGGLALFLGFATHFWGREWLETFQNCTPELAGPFRLLENASVDLLLEHAPLKDLGSVKAMFDDAHAKLGPAAAKALVTDLQRASYG